MEFHFDMNIVSSGSNTRLEITKVFREMLEQAGFSLEKGQRVLAIFDTETRQITLKLPEKQQQS